MKHQKILMSRFLIFFLFLYSSTSNAMMCFPNEDNVNETSINGYTIKFIPGDWRANKFHNLELISNDTENLFHEFDRWVCIIWSEDHTQFALTDGEGSDITEVYIYEIANISKFINIIDYLPSELKELNTKYNFDHTYFEANAWNKSSLQISWYAYELKEGGGATVINADISCQFTNKIPACSGSNIKIKNVDGEGNDLNEVY